MRTIVDQEHPRVVTFPPQPEESPDINALAWSLRRAEPQHALNLATQAYERAKERHSSTDCAYSLLTAAFCRLDTCHYDEAAEYLTEARELFAVLADAKGLAGADLLMGLVDLRYSRYEEALTKFFRTLALYRQLGEPAGEAQALTYAGEVYRYGGDFELSLDYLQRALALANGVGDDLLRSEALLAMSITCRLLGDYKRALTCALEALELKRATGDRLGEVFTFNSLGLIYHDPLERAQALTYYLEGLALSERLGNRRSTLALLGNLGELYAEMGDPEKALEYTLQSLALSEAIGSQHTKAISLEGVGILYARLGDAENAFTHYRRAYELRVEIGDAQGQASTLHYLGDLYRATGQPEKALKHYHQSLKLARKIKHSYTEVQALTSLGHFHAGNGEDHGARCRFEEALALAEGVSLHDSVRELNKALYELHRRVPDFESALAHHEAFYAAEQRLSGEAVARQTARLLIQFELERAQQEAEIQRLRNVELAEANEALKKVNSQNAKLLAKLREQTERLQRQTEEDSLTGLYNRRYLAAYLAREFKRAQRYHHPLCVVMVDIDRFKSINDQFSHALGDDVLKTVAAIFTRTLRTVDVAARYGGEEFVLVLPGTALDRGEVVCERVREAVEAYPWATLHCDLRVTVSLGLAADLTLANFEKLLSLADEKLYDAKRGGRNRVVG